MIETERRLDILQNQNEVEQKAISGIKINVTSVYMQYLD